MSIEAISTVDADLARVASAQSQLSAAQGQVIPSDSADPSQVEKAQAAVASAEAALAAAQAALNSAQTAANATVAPAGDPNQDIAAPVSTHLVDTTA